MKRRQSIIARVVFVIVFAVCWQLYANSRNIMGFPPLDAIFARLLDSFTNPRRLILTYLGHSLISILKGLGIGN